MYDLLKTINQGGCSAKIPANILDSILQSVNMPSSSNLLVGNDTHDDAAVYKLNDEQAIIFTTDFFPPVCSDPFTFGQIASTNALSDVYAMGGQPLLALNLIMFPSQSIPIEVLSEILKGGQSKANEAGALIVGGHTIEDSTPKYGLAVVGTVHPDKIITNSSAMPGDVLILTKPIGTGTIMAGKRLNLVSDINYEKALDTMKQLNKEASKIMVKHNIKCATDITGFGFLGHLTKLANASNVNFEIYVDKIPILEGALDLIDMGCIPGSAFRNQEYVEKSRNYELTNCDYNKKMLLYDPQTSGGLLMCVPKLIVNDVLTELNKAHEHASIVGEIY